MRTNRTSLRRNTAAPRQQLPENSIHRAPTPHALDVWGPRLANFAQVALLAITAGSLYFTVLPLYQKSLLDEAIARKEIELKQATTALEAKYGLLRRVAVRDFVMYTGPDCTGLTEMLDGPGGYAGVQRHVLTMDVKKCILDHEAKAQSLSQLRTEDRVLFRTALSGLADQITKLQSDAAANFARADTDINDSNVEEYAKKRDFSARSLSVLARYMKPEDVAATKRKQAVEELRSERLEAYRTAALDQLLSLNKIKWPTRQQ